MMEYKRIRELHREKGFSQKLEGKKFNLSRRTYANYENGKRSIPLPVICEIAVLYGTSIDYLVELSDSRTPDRRAGGDKP